MKKRILKIIALIVAIALIIGVCWFANALNGNPISKMLADKAVVAYLAGNYAHTDYYVEKLAYSFKFGNYYAHIRSETSMDTQFTLYIDMIGNVYFDTYEDVLSGAITARRVQEEYRELTDQIFESPSFPYPEGICYGTLELNPQAALDDPNVTDIPNYTLVYEDLILDKIYDPRELGAQAGHLIVHVDSDTITFEEAARIMLFIRDEFDKANIPFVAIDFMLQYPLPEEGQRPDEYVWVEDFLYKDIYDDGLEDRIAEADAALRAYYAELDEKYK